jgi:hypothetical protein
MHEADRGAAFDTVDEERGELIDIGAGERRTGGG